MTWCHTLSFTYNIDLYNPTPARCHVLHLLIPLDGHFGSHRRDLVLHYNSSSIQFGQHGGQKSEDAYSGEGSAPSWFTHLPPNFHRAPQSVSGWFNEVPEWPWHNLILYQSGVEKARKVLWRRELMLQCIGRELMLQCIGIGCAWLCKFYNSSLQSPFLWTQIL